MSILLMQGTLRVEAFFLDTWMIVNGLLELQ